jgi:hypothetical protein
MGAERLDQADAQRLIAERLREGAAAAPAPRFAALAPARVAEWEDGDIAVVERGSDLVHLPISSHRSGSGPAVVALKRWLRRLLHPLPQAQSEVNAATARVLHFLLLQLAEQGRAIERFEAELAESRRERQP